MDSFVTRPEPAAVHGGGVLNHAWFTKTGARRKKASSARLQQQFEQQQQYSSAQPRLAEIAAQLKLPLS
jgi:hypothetical protein